MAEALINGIKFFYELKGDPESDKVIFFLNGVMATTSSWSFMLPEYEKAGYRIVLHDFRGQLKSEKPGTDWSFDDHVKDLAGLMDFLEIEKAGFIGTSYGGETALCFAVEYPERCSSIVIIDSVSELNPLLDAAVSSWIAAAETGNGETFYKLMLPWLYSSSFLARNKTWLAERAKAVADLPPDYLEGQIRLYRTFLNIDITDRLSEINTPALIICGEEDILKPVVFSEIIAENLRRSELVLIPECGHAAILEKAHELNEAIMDFLDRRGFSRT